MTEILTIEGFCGYKSFSDVAEALGFITKTIDNNPALSPDLCLDLSESRSWITLDGFYNYAWFSPICTACSVASMSKHWGGGKGKYVPKSDTAKLTLVLLDNTIAWIAKNNPEK